MGHIGTLHGVVALGQSLQPGILGAGGQDVFMQFCISVGTGNGGSSAVIASIDVCLPMGTGNDAVLAELEAPPQDGVLKGGPHLGEGQCRGPSESGVA